MEYHEEAQSRDLRCGAFQQTGTVAVRATIVRSPSKRANGAFGRIDLSGSIGTFGTRAWNVTFGTSSFGLSAETLQSLKSAERGQKHF